MERYKKNNFFERFYIYSLSLTNPKDIADALNNYFSNVATGIKSSIKYWVFWVLVYIEAPQRMKIKINVHFHFNLTF